MSKCVEDRNAAPARRGIDRMLIRLCPAQGLCEDADAVRSKSQEAASIFAAHG
jgi:hypothetical protein